MGTIIGPERNKQQYTGEAGNKLICDGYYKQNGAGTLADLVELFVIPAGSKIVEFAMAWSTGAASETLALGWKYRDGSTGGAATAFLAATAVTTAGSAVADCFVPAALTALGSSGNSSGVFDKDVIVYATNAGAAIPANQQIYAKAEGIYVGTL
jgi:hypothetical protein